MKLNTITFLMLPPVIYFPATTVSVLLDLSIYMLYSEEFPGDVNDAVWAEKRVEHCRILLKIVTLG